MYVCDLEGNLSSDTLNEMIDNYVLNRISTNGFCLLKEEKSKEVEWSDNFPLNYCDKSDNPNEWEKCLDDEYRNLSQETANCDKFTLTPEEVENLCELLSKKDNVIDEVLRTPFIDDPYTRGLIEEQKKILPILTRIKQWQIENQ